MFDVPLAKVVSLMVQTDVWANLPHRFGTAALQTRATLLLSQVASAHASEQHSSSTEGPFKTQGRDGLVGMGVSNNCLCMAPRGMSSSCLVVLASAIVSPTPQRSAHGFLRYVCVLAREVGGDNWQISLREAFAMAPMGWPMCGTCSGRSYCIASAMVPSPG